MIPTRVASALAVAAILAASPVQGVEVAHTEIIGLHLGMSATEVFAALTRQGYQAHRSADIITATTKDGQVQVALSANRGVIQITYALFNQGAGAPAKINDAVLAKFGVPDQATPPTWCRAVTENGLCPPEQATLTFLPAQLTVRLKAAREPGE
jgi:hypothetical protein